MKIINRIKEKLMNEATLEYIHQQREANYNYVMEHREDLINMFPGCWVSVQNQQTGMANYSLDYIMKSLRTEGTLAPDMLFAFAEDYHFTVVGSVGDLDG